MNNNVLNNIIPSQPPIEGQSDAYALKSRLEWGEPAFTILDIRDRMTYNEGHIMGAMPMPMEDLVDRASSSLEKSRDIYIYGASDEETAQGVQSLRAAGFKHVSELKGGLAAWKAIGGPTEGIVEAMTPAGADDYNVVARMQNHQENQQKAVSTPTQSTTQSPTPATTQEPTNESNVGLKTENQPENQQKDE